MDRQKEHYSDASTGKPTGYPVVDMAQKRNSHVYVEEGTHHHHHHLHHQDASSNPIMGASYRSRRSSWGSSQNDMSLGSKETEDMSRSTVSPRDIPTTPRTQGAAAPSKDLPASGSLVAAVSRSLDATAVAATSLPTPTFTRFSDVPAVSQTIRPINFGLVLPDIYRSSYPKPEDYDFLRNLNLKTIVTLVKKDEEDFQFQSFITSSGIRQVVFNIKGTKKEAIPAQTMNAIVGVVLDKRNHPLLMHCNHGKHRTGCVVAAVRKISGWNLQRTLDEYQTYAAPKIRECDVEYITAYQPLPAQGAPKEDSRLKRMHVRTFFRALIFTTFVMTLWTISGTRIAASHEPTHI